MDYSLKEELLKLGDVIHAPPPPKDGTGGDDGEKLPPPQDEVVDIKIIKKALSRESSASSKIKVEVVRLLVEAGADPAICNNHGHSSLSIAKNLNESMKIIAIMKTKMNPNSWNKWFWEILILQKSWWPRIYYNFNSIDKINVINVII